MFFNYKSILSSLIIFALIPMGVFSVYFISINSRNLDTSSANIATNNSITNNENTNNWSRLIEIEKSVAVSPQIQKKIKLPILMYHHINTLEKVKPNDKVGIGLHVSPEMFEEQLQYLASKNYNTINSFQLQGYLMGKSSLPPNPIMLTFDDGFKDNYDKAFPLLQKYNMVGDFAIITSAIGTREYMDWENIKTLVDSGMGIASHTHNHCSTAVKDKLGNFSSSPEDSTQKPCSKFASNEKLTTGQIKYEFQESKKVLEEKLGIKVSHLVYPFGYHNKQSHDIAREVGYDFATTVAPQKDNIADLENPFEVSRTRAQGQQTGELSGFFKN